jgi:hypothetical protein
MLQEVTCETTLFRNGREIRTPDFPSLVEAHRCRVPGTAELEQRGQHLQEGGFQAGDLRCFIRGVCAWGGRWGSEAAARALQMAPQELTACFHGVWDLLEPEGSDVGEALSTIVEGIAGFGVSFGSKHLRFLRPDLCPVLDGNISEAFGHPLDADGYRCLSSDCIKIARKLRECGVRNPMNRPEGEWFAADVEMGLFARARQWHPED